MKLFYYKERSGIKNFGDDLNPWLFSRLIPELFDDDGSELLIGIGTILNDLIPAAEKRFVFSSGVGYGTGLPSFDDSWTIYCVRGPRSAQRLGLPADRAVIDGAVLLRKFYDPTLVRKSWKISFMPHITAAVDGGESWRRICGEVGLHYVDPQSPIETVLDDIAASEVLITEAMHGAIIAETLRVPWAPVSTTPIILPFKWHDWCESIGLSYDPTFILPLWDIGPGGLIEKGKKYVKLRLVERKMRQLVRELRPVIGSEQTLNSLSSKLEERLEQLRSDWRRRRRD